MPEPKVSSSIRRAQMASHRSLMPYSALSSATSLREGLPDPRPTGPLQLSIVQRVMSQEKQQKAQEPLRMFLIALPEHFDVDDTVGDTDIEDSPGKQSTVPS